MSKYSFLKNDIEGIDSFETKSHTRIALKISEMIKEDENQIPHLIGIEGEWGSGKSNIIKLIEKNLEENKEYEFFYYDIWAHQEALERRSFLEDLTEKATEMLGEEWSNKLENLLSKKTRSEIQKLENKVSLSQRIYKIEEVVFFESIRK